MYRNTEHTHAAGFIEQIRGKHAQVYTLKTLHLFSFKMYS